MNKTTRAISRTEFEKIVSTINEGFKLEDREVKVNNRIAVLLLIQGNLGVRIGDLLNLKLNDIIKTSEEGYRLNIVEQKTGKARTFTVPTELYITMMEYANTNNIKVNEPLFPISKRMVQHQLQLVCKHLKLENISTHSFRKMYATELYNLNKDINLVRHLMQHSSTVTTQKYLGISSEDVETAIQKTLYIPKITT